MHNLGYHAQALKRLGVKDLGMRALLAYPIENESRANARARLRLSLSFTDDVPEGKQWQYRYKRSVAVFELLFDRAGALPIIPGGVTLQRAGGAVYPAMRLLGMADNLAIFPEFVSEGLTLRRVRWIRVVDAYLERMSYTLETEAEATDFTDGIIHWKELGGDAAERRTQIAYEKEHWIMRSGKPGSFFQP